MELFYRQFSYSQGHNVTSVLRNIVFASLLSTSVYATDTLRFIGDVNFVTGTKFQETEIGGLSGITYDKEQRKMLAISDDKSWANETRFYEFDIKLTKSSFEVTPSKVVKLKSPAGGYFKKGEADFEGVSLYKGDVLISSEGSEYRKPASPSLLYRYSRDGEFKEFVNVPDKFFPAKKVGDALVGTRDNKGFEALSTSLDGKTTFLGSEESLYQDGDIATIANSSTPRIAIYTDLKPTSEVAYNLEKVEAIKAIDGSSGENGLVDIAAIDEKNFFTLERSWIPFKNKNIIRIYRCTITPETTDTLKLDTLKGVSFKPVDKVLVADLDDFLEKMNPKVLDNIEGISFGPTLPNGNRTLIVVSDNNFGKGQRTLFMAFEVITK